MRYLSSFSQMVNLVTEGLKKGQEAIREQASNARIQILFNGGERFKNRGICQYSNYKAHDTLWQVSSICCS